MVQLLLAAYGRCGVAIVASGVISQPQRLRTPGRDRRIDHFARQVIGHARHHSDQAANHHVPVVIVADNQLANVVEVVGVCGGDSSSALEASTPQDSSVAALALTVLVILPLRARHPLSDDVARLDGSVCPRKPDHWVFGEECSEAAKGRGLAKPAQLPVKIARGGCSPQTLQTLRTTGLTSTPAIAPRLGSFRRTSHDQV